MDWSTKRKVIYGAASIAVILVVFVYEFRSSFFPDPTCFDKKQNGFESGIDCGGTCALKCNNEVTQISVEWARAVKTGSNTYDFVGLVSNKNINSAPKKNDYTFTAFNRKGEIIKSISGNTVSLVGNSFPIIEQNIQISDYPASVVLKVFPSPYFSTQENPKVPFIKVTNFNYEAGDISRIYVSIENVTRNVYLKLPVRMIAYDENDNVIAVGESILPSLDKEEKKDVVFTWHYLLSSAPTKFRAYIMIDPFGLVY